MAYEYKAIMVERKGPVAIVTINQPKVLNALVQDVLDELTIAAKELDLDDSVRAVVLTGAGRAFCAGGDLNRFIEGFTQVGGLDYMDAVHPFTKTWVNMRKPTIAAVNGAATGAGLSLLLICDMAIASDRAKFGSAFVNMGLVPDCALAYFLPRVIGVQKAKELIYTGKLINALEADTMGLINKVVPAEQLMEEAIGLAESLAGGAGYAIRMCKRLVNMSLDVDFNTLLSMEGIIQSGCFITKDSQEAVSAFLEKRKPVFRNE